MEATTKHDLDKLKIDFNGLFNLGDIISLTKNWLKKKYYVVLEQKHKYKTKEREVEFIGFKKINEYVKCTIEVIILSEDIKDVEVVKEGKKLNMQEGKLRIRISGRMDLDWQKMFKGKKFLTFLQDFFHKYIIRSKIENEWFDALEKEEYSLRDELKNKIFEGD